MNDDTQKGVLDLPETELPAQPLTIDEIQVAADKRVARITKEFEQAFEFIATYEKSVTIFGSARFQPGHPYYEKAVSLAKRISTELGYAVFTGGGPGVMEAANKGAFEAGGKSLGLTIVLPREQITNPYLTAHLDFDYFFSRKVAMTFAAEAYVYFPGGFGTLNEFFEILTLVQTNKIEKVPLILFGSEFWKPLEQYVRDQLLARDAISREDLGLFVITDDEDEALRLIKDAPVRNGIPYHYDN